MLNISLNINDLCLVSHKQSHKQTSSSFFFSLAILDFFFLYDFFGVGNCESKIISKF